MGMGLFKSKHERELARDIAKEKSVSFEGKALQHIGKIPRGSEIRMTLKPKDMLLNIRFEKMDVTLPYDRIAEFTLERESAEVTSVTTNVAKTVLQSGLLGRGIVGKVGSIASNFIPHTNQMVTIASLVYIDKFGEEQTLRFERQRRFEHGAFDDYEDSDKEADDFENAMRRIIARVHGDDINEL